MSAKDMKELRLRAGLGQAEMADRMGLGKTAYVDLEGDDPDWKKFKKRHNLALEAASVEIALERRDASLATPKARRNAFALVDLAKSEAPYQVAGRTMDGILQAGCDTAASAILWGQTFFDGGASSVVITHEGRPWSLADLTAEVAAGRME